MEKVKKAALTHVVSGEVFVGYASRPLQAVCSALKEARKVYPTAALFVDLSIRVQDVFVCTAEKETATSLH